MTRHNCTIAVTDLQTVKITATEDPPWNGQLKLYYQEERKEHHKISDKTIWYKVYDLQKRNKRCSSLQARKKMSSCVSILSIKCGSLYLINVCEMVYKV